MTSKYFHRDELPVVLNAQQVADFLGVSYPTALSHFKEKDFPRFSTNKRCYRVDRDLFFEWYDQRSAPGKNQAAD